MKDKRDRAARNHALKKLGGLFEEELAAELARLLDEREARCVIQPLNRGAETGTTNPTGGHRE